MYNIKRKINNMIKKIIPILLIATIILYSCNGNSNPGSEKPNPDVTEDNPCKEGGDKTKQATINGNSTNDYYCDGNNPKMCDANEIGDNERKECKCPEGQAVVDKDNKTVCLSKEELESNKLCTLLTEGYQVKDLIRKIGDKKYCKDKELSDCGGSEPYPNSSLTGCTSTPPSETLEIRQITKINPDNKVLQYCAQSNKWPLDINGEKNDSNCTSVKNEYSCENYGEGLTRKQNVLGCACPEGTVFSITNNKCEPESSDEGKRGCMGYEVRNDANPCKEQREVCTDDNTFQLVDLKNNTWEEALTTNPKDINKDCKQTDKPKPICLEGQEDIADINCREEKKCDVKESSRAVAINGCTEDNQDDKTLCLSNLTPGCDIENLAATESIITEECSSNNKYNENTPCFRTGDCKNKGEGDYCDNNDDRIRTPGNTSAKGNHYLARIPKVSDDIAIKSGTGSLTVRVQTFGIEVPALYNQNGEALDNKKKSLQVTVMTNYSNIKVKEDGTTKTLKFSKNNNTNLTASDAKIIVTDELTFRAIHNKITYGNAKDMNGDRNIVRKLIDTNKIVLIGLPIRGANGTLSDKEGWKECDSGARSTKVKKGYKISEGFKTELSMPYVYSQKIGCKKIMESTNSRTLANDFKTISLKLKPHDSKNGYNVFKHVSFLGSSFVSRAIPDYISSINDDNFIIKKILLLAPDQQNYISGEVVAKKLKARIDTVLKNVITKDLSNGANSHFKQVVSNSSEAQDHINAMNTAFKGILAEDQSFQEQIEINSKNVHTRKFAELVYTFITKERTEFNAPVSDAYHCYDHTEKPIGRAGFLTASGPYDNDYTNFSAYLAEGFVQRCKGLSTGKYPTLTYSYKEDDSAKEEVQKISTNNKSLNNGLVINIIYAENNIYGIDFQPKKGDVDNVKDAQKGQNINNGNDTLIAKYLDSNIKVKEFLAERAFSYVDIINHKSATATGQCLEAIMKFLAGDLSDMSAITTNTTPTIAEFKECYTARETDIKTDLSSWFSGNNKYLKLISAQEETTGGSGVQVEDDLKPITLTVDEE